MAVTPSGHAVGMARGLETLSAGVDALLDDDVDVLDDAQLDELVIGLSRHEARLTAVKARVLQRWESSAGWAGDGSRTAATALARDTMTSQKTATRELHRARALASMPATAAALAAGRFSVDYVDLLVRANQTWRNAVFADHEQLLVDEIAGLRYHQARRMIDYWCQQADAQAADERAQRDRDNAHLHASTTLDGNVVIDGVLDAVRGAIVTGELKRLEHDLYLADKRNGVVRTPAQRRADALVEMARRSSGAAGTPARPLVTVVVGDESLARLCELANGTVIAPGALVPGMCTAMLETVIFDGPSTVISVSRGCPSTGAIRRAIQVRDRHCQHPSGCDIAAEDCDVDHITPYADDGLTAQWNGRLGCQPHNRNPHKRDCDSQPFPVVHVDRLDELRARVDWQHQHYQHDDNDSEDDDQNADDDTSGSDEAA
jgi:Domain of unknown function (DUF222)